ncbi:MAG: hypothetical protein RLY86_139 [Pseudomonadota bacterium]|jgi:PBSX family phage portal protein
MTAAETAEIAHAVPSARTATEPMVFAFGDPEPVLDGRGLADYYQSLFNGSWYEWPVAPQGLAKALVANVHHESAIRLKANILSGCFVPHRLLTRERFKRLALDYLVFGNAWLEKRNSWLGSPLELRPTQAKHTRRTADGEALMLIDGNEHRFAAGTTLHLAEPDINQEVYGVPAYLSALQSALLNEAATLFRRKYYKNGSHAGFILYLTDAAQTQEDVDALRDALKSAKGPGNFRNLFMYAPNGKADGLKLIPVSEVAAKDEFLSIKTVTRDDVLASHRVPPQLLGVVPSNTGGFGDIEKAAGVFAVNELAPLKATFSQINDWVGEEVVRFTPYSVTPPGPVA